MTILRFLTLLLLVLNALAFAAINGWLGGGSPAGEAGRLASQLHPERIRLANETGATGLAPVAAEPAALPAATAFVSDAPSAPETTLAAAQPNDSGGDTPADPHPIADASAPAVTTPAAPIEAAAAVELPATATTIEQPPAEPAVVPAPSQIGRAHV